MRECIKNILVIRNDRFGEFLLNIPAIRAVKETYPDAKIILAVNEQVKELARAIEYIDNVVIWNKGFRKSLGRQGFDACIVLNPTKEAHIASFLARIPLRVGYDRKWGFLLNKRIKDNKGLGLKHEVESNLELVNLIGATTKDKSLALGRLSEQRNAKYSGAIAVHPFTSDIVKQWPLERFMELAARIAQELKSKVVLVGRIKDWGQPPSDAPRRIGSAGAPPPAGVIDLINKTSLLELVQVLKQCRLLVTCDSGPMQLHYSEMIYPARPRKDGARD
jgi:ADP-heptose:LPS heptosyltransferase